MASQHRLCHEGPGHPRLQTLVPVEAVHPRQEALQVVEVWAESHGKDDGQEVGAVCAVEGVVIGPELREGRRSHLQHHKYAGVRQSGV